MSGPHQPEARAQLEENRAGESLVAGSPWHHGDLEAGMVHDHLSWSQECPSMGNGTGPFVAKGWAGVRITGSSSIGWEGTDVFPS